MTKKPSYSELLRDPRWQKKRLEILQRDKFTCRSCQDTTTTLHVHHSYYQKGNMPWEYPNSSLITLCAPCHEIETQEAFGAKEVLINELCALGFLSSDFVNLAYKIHKNPTIINKPVGKNG
jgi:hypothetical protein